MFSKALSTAAVALAAASLVSAQTYTLCNPLKKTCPNDPAVGDNTVTVDFTKGKNDFFTLADGTSLTYDPSLGAIFKIENVNQAPTITSSKYIMFGKVDVVARASSGVGVVTSVVLQSDDLDEIDWEWLGGDAYHVQTNYFSKGDTSTYDRGGMSEVSDPQDNFHTYTIEWTQDKIDWIIDGATVRTLTYADAKGGTTFPQTPMQLKLGTWVAGGPDAPEGTVEWAGGHTDFSKAPFYGYYQSVTVTDYSKGVKGAKEYSYGDHSGTYESINVLTTSGGSSSGSSSSSSSSAAASSATSSKAASKPSTVSKAASSTFVTVTSSAAASSGTAAATSAAATSADPTGTAEETATSTASTPAVATSGSSTATAAPSTVTTNAGVKSGVNVALMGAAAFAAYFAL